MAAPRRWHPEEIFRYVYAVLHSPGYRSRYAEFLKIEFPRLPLTGNLLLFRALARLGGELVALHLLDSAKLDDLPTTYTGRAHPDIEKVPYQ
jgi:predicted helicase